MKSLLLTLLCSLLALQAHAEPLRVFIRGGKKTHPPGAHEHERFLNDWKVLLAKRGMVTDGRMSFPTAEQLATADVLVMYAQDAGNILPDQRPILESFLQRGGGIVVIHAAAVATKAEMSVYWKATLGGSWVQGTTKWKEGPMTLLYPKIEAPSTVHPITKDAVTFSMDDEIYYHLDISPEVHVLASAVTPDTAPGATPEPQLWTYEKVAPGAPAGAPAYRAVVCIPGHLYVNFDRPNFRAIILRSIAWAGKRPNADEFCTPEEIAAVAHPETP